MNKTQKIIILTLATIPYVIWRIWNYRGKFGLNEIQIVILTYIIVSLLIWLVLHKKQNNNKHHDKNAN